MRFALNDAADTCQEVSKAAETRPISTEPLETTELTTGWSGRRAKKVVKPWIEENIKCRECATFIATPSNQEADDQTCGCGYLYSEHSKDVLVDTHKTWSYQLHTRLVDGNAYGRLNFVDEDGNQQPSFVKLAVDFEEKTKTVIKLLESRWSLPRPNLLISVTGGAKDFNVSPELLAEFKRGLMKAAKSTDAWVITGGTNTGVMKLVGEAVKGYCGSNVTAIGIATWGIIKNKETLIRPTKRKQNKKKLVFDYTTKSQPLANEAYMDPNHSHFLLVDNGTTSKYGVEIAMRGAIEAAICNHYLDDYNIPNGEQCKLPMICILVEGGPNSIATCLAAIRNGNPVLVLHGSGRSADIIAKAHSYTQCVVTYENNLEAIQRYLPDDYKDDIMADINKHFFFLSEEKRAVLFDSLLELIKYDNLLTIYRLQGDRNNDFDNAILIAMIRSVNDAKAKMSQMMLAITWDRLQIAQDLILNRHTFEDHEMEQLLRVAIIQNRTGFVQKLLDADADMKHYLTYKELTSLYNTISVKSQTIGKVLLTKAERYPDGLLTLRLIGRFLEEIIEGSYKSPYTRREFNYSEVEDSVIASPYDAMVVFAAIMQYHEMALLFWGRCKEPIVTGLIAAKINWYLSDFESNKLACDEDNAELLQSQGTDFEERASEVIIECYREFERKQWTTILTAPRKIVNNMNLIELAKNINADNFIAESPIQSYLNHTWMGQIHHTTSMKKILFCFLPPLFLLLRYNKKNLTAEEKQAWERHNEKKNQKKSGIRSIVMQPSVREDNPDIEQDCLHDTISLAAAPNRRKLNWDEAFFAYYRSPATKFILHFITYFLFLVTYAYTLLVRPKKEDLLVRNLIGYDFILFLWVLGQIPSEWDQLMKQNPVTLREKMLVHFREVFNLLDMFGIVTYLISFSLKLIADTDLNGEIPISGGFTLNNAYHLMNIIAFMFLSLRVVQVLEVSMTTGPKIIMIGKMMIDLAFFIFLLLIFLFTYGICAQALQSPNHIDAANEGTQLTGYRIYNVFLRPALNAFGEIGLEDMQDDLKTGHCKENETCPDDFGDFLSNRDIPSIHYYVLQVCMFVYLLFVNILLMNLLIAIFSNTYATIEADAAKLWKVQWCEVVIEFRNRQPLPNPFSLIYYLVFLIRWIVTLLQCKKCPVCINEEPEAPDIDYYDLNMRVSEAREKYIQQREQDDEAGDIRKSLNFIKDKLLISQMNMTGPDNLLSRMKSTDVADKEVLEIKHHDLHVDSRKSPYIGTDIKRAIVPDRNVPWEVSFAYNPTEYTEQNILKNTDILEVDPSDPTKIIGVFNKEVDYDGDSVDRISFCGTYQLADGKPLNPKGRTGLRGRGQLQRWGPNHTADPIVTRWARDPAGKRLVVDRSPILEFVGIFLKESRKWAIPGGPIKHGELLTTALSREFCEDALGSIGADKKSKQNIMAMLHEHLALGIAVYKGYIDDPRNTDNAWVESHAINYHDSLGTSFSNFPLQVSAEGEALNVEWISLDRNLDLYGNHEWVLEKVCFHRHAYNPFSLRTPTKKHLPVVS